MAPKKTAAPGWGVAGTSVLVTGGSGFVGQRLVEMLVERGATRVISFDITPKPKDALNDGRIEYVQGDITDFESVSRAVKGVDCVFHIAALVGPFHPRPRYMAVNYQGTLNIIDAARKHGVKKIVMSSSPSTRFHGGDINGEAEADLPFPKRYLQEYAESKAMGEKALRAACSDTLMTVAVAPHQVYGPRDSLFLPNLLHAAGTGMLRIWGNGQNRVAFTHVDNYCHGLMLGHDALYKGSPALGQFYIVTDGDFQLFWRVLDQAAVSMGFASMWTKFKLPYMLMMAVAYIFVVVGLILGRKMKV
ncbi:unnamed protein product, partial [Phaeothamnion confervicola]